jgi:hypothetical protein
MSKVINKLLSVVVCVVFTAALAPSVDGQGRGRGGGMPRGQGSPGPANPRMGPPAGVGVDRGLGTASERSRGRSDRGLANASMRSGGRSDDGLARARANSNRAANELPRYSGLARRLNTTPAQLHRRYEEALQINPNLEFGQFLAANVVAGNPGGRRRGISADVLLDGLANGRNFGQTLQRLGLSSSEARLAEKNAWREVRNARQR